jgi:hypothetical protein
MSSEQRTARETLEQAFRAGFAACQDNTDKYGEYNGDSIEEEFAAFAASLRAAPAPEGETPRPRERELCRRCEGNGVIKIPGGVSVCPRCHQDCYEPSAPASPGPTPEGRVDVVFRGLTAGAPDSEAARLMAITGEFGRRRLVQPAALTGGTEETPNEQN